MPGFGCRGVSLALNVLVAGHGVVDLLCSTDLGTHGNGQCITIALFFYGISTCIEKRSFTAQFHNDK